MPTISMFSGILVTLLFEDNARHHLPHFHVRYQGDKASIAIESGHFTCVLQLPIFILPICML